MDEYRYLFLVRQDFGKGPEVDAFYKMKGPVCTSSELMTMQTLKDDWMADEIREDSRSYNGMELRARMDGGCFGSVLKVTSEEEIERDILDSVLKMKFNDGTLEEWLRSASV